VAAEAIIVNVEKDLEDLIPLFLARRKADQSGIAAALSRRDFEALRKIGHNMNGAGASYGFERISELGEQLTKAARAGDVAALGEIKNAFDDYMRRLVVNYM
jgi:histidine phosphotransfer protein HptB